METELNLETLKDLERRLVEAKGAERVLDYFIRHALIDTADIPYPHGEEKLREVLGYTTGKCYECGAGEGQFMVELVPYSASLDAAIGLVERLGGWLTELTSYIVSGDDKERRWGWLAFVRGFPRNEADNWYSGWGGSLPGNTMPTPALAVCLALVRALIAREAGNGAE